MAGVLDPKTFAKAHKIGDKGEFFATMLLRGQTIKSISLERELDKDDDWVKIEFSDPDAAITKLR